MKTVLPLLLIRSYIFSSIMVLLLIMVIVFLGDLVYMVRETQDLLLPTTTVALLSLFRLPELVLIDMLPIVVLIGSMLATLSFISNRLLLAIQGFGVSLWGFLVGPIIGFVSLGIFVSFVINPISTLFYNWHVDILQRENQGDEKFYNFQNTLWFQTTIEKESIVIRAEDIDTERGVVSGGLNVMYFDGERDFVRSLYAAKALINEDMWQLFDVVQNRIVGKRDVENKSISFMFLTDMPTIDDISSPKDYNYRMSLFDLPASINRAKEIGFEVPLYERRYHLLLSLPLMLISCMMMGVLFASGVGLRGGGVLKVVINGLVFAILLFFSLRLLAFVAISGLMPAWLSVWIIPFVVGGFALGFLIRRFEI